MILSHFSKWNSFSDPAVSNHPHYEALPILGGLVTKRRDVPIRCLHHTPEKVNNICRYLMLDYLRPVAGYHTQLIPFAGD